MGFYGIYKTKRVDFSGGQKIAVSGFSKPPMILLLLEELN